MIEIQQRDCRGMSLLMNNLYTTLYSPNGKILQHLLHGHDQEVVKLNKFSLLLDKFKGLKGMNGFSASGR